MGNSPALAPLKAENLLSRQQKTRTADTSHRHKSPPGAKPEPEVDKHQNTKASWSDARRIATAWYKAGLVAPSYDLTPLPRQISGGARTPARRGAKSRRSRFWRLPARTLAFISIYQPVVWAYTAKKVNAWAELARVSRP